MDPSTPDSNNDQPFYLNAQEPITVEQLSSNDLKSLGDNVKLLAVIQKLSDDLITKSQVTSEKVNNIQRDAEIKSVGVKNLINEFQILADSQFIENRIYEPEEETAPTENEIVKQAEPAKDKEILPIICACIGKSLQFIDENFGPFSQTKDSNESDDDDDYVRETLARAIEKDNFNQAPLPAIIGSRDFFSIKLFSDEENGISSDDSDDELFQRKTNFVHQREQDDLPLFGDTSNSSRITDHTAAIEPSDDLTQAKESNPNDLPRLPDLSTLRRNSKKESLLSSEDDSDDSLFKDIQSEPRTSVNKLTNSGIVAATASGAHDDQVLIAKKSSIRLESDGESDDFIVETTENPRSSAVSPTPPPPVPRKSKQKPTQLARPAFLDNDSSDDDLFKPQAAILMQEEKSLFEDASSSSRTADNNTAIKPSHNLPKIKESIPNNLPKLPDLPTLEKDPKKESFLSSDDDSDDSLFSGFRSNVTSKTISSPNIKVTPSPTTLRLSQATTTTEKQSTGFPFNPAQPETRNKRKAFIWSDESDDSDDLFKSAGK